MSRLEGKEEELVWAERKIAEGVLEEDKLLGSCQSTSIGFYLAIVKHKRITLQQNTKW